MDGVSVAASVISIATAGIQISVRLITLSTQISSASERVSAVANDVSLTAGILHQLGELMTQKVTGDGVSIFSQGGLETTRTSAAICERIFQEVEREFGRASTQLRSCKKVAGGRIKLSKSEKLKWPFLQPSIDLLRADLREAKGTLMLMLQVATLALSKKMADSNASASAEQSHMFRAIVALRQQQDRIKSEDEGANMQSSFGKAGPEFPLDRQASETESTFTMGTDDSPTLTRSSSSYVTLATPLHSATRPPSIGDHHYHRYKADEPANATSTSGAKGSAKQPEELSEDFDSSSATLADPQSVSKYIIANTSLPSVGTFYSAERMRASGRPSDDQVQPSHFPSKSRKPIPPANESGADSKTLPVNANVELPSGADPELRMFMLKPIVKDFFDKIELSWSIQNPRMHVSAIKSHLRRMETDNLPSVMDMLETLYDHEHSIIDVHQGQGELLSLKRTKTDIQHKDILFKGVPGLQFVVEPKRISNVSKGTLESSVRLPEVSRSLAELTPRDIEPTGPDDRADLQGLLLNEQGFVLGKDGFPVAKLITGILEVAVGRPLNANLQLVDDFDRVIASCELLPRPVQKVTNQGPFAAFTECVVDSTGLVKDDADNAVGRVIHGDVEHLAGCTVNKDGQIIDMLGRLQGHAALFKDDEEWTSIDPPPNNHLFGETKRSRSELIPHDTSVFKEVEPNVHAEDERAKKIDELREMEETLKKKFSEKERRYHEHEVELRARRVELQMLESQRSMLEKEKVVMRTRQTSMQDRNERHPKVMGKKNKKVLGLQLPLERSKVVTTELKRSAVDNNLSIPPILSPRVYQNKESSETENSLLNVHRRKNTDIDQVPSTEIFKSFRVSREVSVDQILPAALKKYNMKANVSDVDLYIKYEDTELLLGREEKPLLIFKRLEKEGRKPSFELRRRTAVDQPEPNPMKPDGATSDVQLDKLRSPSPAGEANVPPSISRESPKRAPARDESTSHLQSNPKPQSHLNSVEALQQGPFSGATITEDACLQQEPIFYDKPDCWAVCRYPLPSPTTSTDQQASFSRKFSAKRMWPDLSDLADLEREKLEKPEDAESGPELVEFVESDMHREDAEPLLSVDADDVEAELDEGFEAEEYSDDEDDDGKGVNYAPFLKHGGPVNSTLETEKEIVDSLLNKYTTLFDKPNPHRRIRISGFEIL